MKVMNNSRKNSNNHLYTKISLQTLNSMVFEKVRQY